MVERLLIALVLILVVSFYYWTVESNGNEPLATTSGYYPMLARAFVHHHLYIETLPSPELLALSDPYDPEQNKDYSLHDASLYKGRYYIYFGPAPVVLLFVPYLELTLHDFRQAMAVPLFCSIGYLISARLFLKILADYYPTTSLRLKVASLFSLGLASGLPVLLRRPDIYEVAISCAYCFMQLAFFNFYLALQQPGQTMGRLLIVSGCLGVAAASRPNCVLAAAVFAFFLIWLCWQRSANRQPLFWKPLLALGPVGLMGLLLAYYNFARFGNPLDFGNTYQLAGADMHTTHLFEIGNIPYNLWYYFCCPPHLVPTFPFIYGDSLIWSEKPKQFMGLESIAGLFLLAPVSFFSLALPLLMSKATSQLHASLMFMVLATLGPLLIILGFPSATMRYICDFAPTFVFIGCLVFCHLETSFVHKSERGRLCLQELEGILLYLGCFIGVFLSFTGYYNYLQKSSPDTYDLLAWIFHPIEIIAKALTDLF